MTTNYNINNVDLDSTYDFSPYINVSDANYTNVSQLAITARKSVMFGQQTLTYAYLNVGSAFNVAQYIGVPKVDIDPVTITAVYPQGVIFTDTTNSQTYFRGNFALLENCPNTFLSLNTAQTPYISSPVQIGIESNWTNINCGYSGALASKKTINTQITRNGSDWLYGWGYNVYGQFPNVISNSGFYSPTPMYVPGTWVNFQSSSSSWYFLAVQSNGTIWACGYNSSGQLGLGDVVNRSTPTQVGTGNTWSKVALTGSTTYALQSNGTLWGWGSNGSTQLGISDTTNRSSPIQLGSTSTWTQIAAGRAWGYGIQSNGTLWGWALGNFGQAVGSNYQIQVGTSLWKQISSSGGFTAPYPFTLGIQTDGTLWAYGNNSWGQLGINTVGGNYSSFVQVGSANNWAQISCGFTHWAAIQSNGTLWVCGINTFGELGINTTTVAVSTPIQVGNLSTWIKVSAGRSQTLAIQSNGTLWVWGGPQVAKYDDYTQPNKIIYGL
jgi:alpha-tubulin suppressor-like RCC1 family protein